MRNRQLILAMLVCVTAAEAREPVILREGGIDRPLRYTPDNGDFLITDGTGRFNRPLYTAHTPARVDAGDRPEFGFLFQNRNGEVAVGGRSCHRAISAGGDDL